MEQVITGIPVTFTPSALEEVRKLMSAPGFEADRYLRVGVKGGGCSGLSYVLAFETRQPEDEVYAVEGIPCIMNPAHAIYLHGMEVDWGSGLDARGFEFKNPNASATCGCGSSFAV
jgi:iron-sulfur cluster assembly protein